jgi:catechol 2,3-dioxygenase-like lactoylglutathione lyase family enzyme
MKKTFEESSRLHMALNTRHFEESIEFYKALFNAEPSKIKPGYAKFEIKSPPLNLTLNSAEKVTGNQLNHLGIEVKAEGDVNQQNERFKKLGLETLSEKSTVCCYATQDKVWVKDPDGNSWETFFVLKDSEERDEPGRSTICCAPMGSSSSSCGV